jgi:DNA processing protein
MPRAWRAQDVPAPPSFKATPLDRSYPARLRDLAPPPPFVEACGVLAGALDALPPSVAIVGTRDPLPEAADFARRLARAVAAAGGVVVSGGAIGIDHAAHEGAIEAGGATLVVLPAGVDEWTPPRHRYLFERCLEVGALVAIRERGTPVHRAFYLQRNAVIAALADHVVVVACPVVSGARSTAQAARTLGRALWVVPGAPWDATMAGCAAELAIGARALDTPSRFLRAVGLGASRDDARALEPVPPPALPRTRARRNAPASEERSGRAPSSIDSSAVPTIQPANSSEKALLDALASGPSCIDALVLQTALGVAELRALLLTWTVEGVVREGPAGVFSLPNIRIQRGN